MRTTHSPSETDDLFTFIDIQPRDLRADLLAGLSMARRTLENAKLDLAQGLKIEPLTIKELERVVSEYQQMLTRLDSRRK